MTRAKVTTTGQTDRKTKRQKDRKTDIENYNIDKNSKMTKMCFDSMIERSRNY